MHGMHQLSLLVLCFVLLPAAISDADDEDVPHEELQEVASNDNTTLDTTSTTEELDPEDLEWVKDAVKDVMYYLRAYKFNEFDRRYNLKAPTEGGTYFSNFPSPPLRSLHWEVRKHCAPSFLGCIEYLVKRVRDANLQRVDDTSVVITEQKWTRENHSEQIQTTETECKKMRDLDDATGFPFEGPLGRFQWRTTASYYLCWYTMNEVPLLEHLGERCDNFANCLDWKWGATNKDPRADDTTPFACAMYSVCPDPCCPMRHLTHLSDCWDLPTNPCQASNSQGHRECQLNRTHNTDFTDIVLNHWNVSCECPQEGYVWTSKFGDCVDVNECSLDLHSCDQEKEVCLNLPGDYRCVCNWGFIWNPAQNSCVASDALGVIKKSSLVKEEPKKTATAQSLIKLIIKKIFG